MPGLPAMKLLHELGDEAAGLRGAIRASFCRGRAPTAEISVVMLARSSSVSFRPSMAVPTDDCVE
jgi:hypothetical protein